MKHNTLNYFGICRSDTHITQGDIAALMDFKDNSLISRYENDVREPSMEMLLVYHLLFDIPLSVLANNQREVAKERLIVRIGRLITQLLNELMTTKVQWRIDYLTKAHTRLSEEERYGK